MDSSTNTTSRQHDHLRKRAEALISAVYYAECRSAKISSDGAVAAEEKALSEQSRWWLNGNDPDHPSLQSTYYDELLNTSCECSKENDALPLLATTNDDNNNNVGGIQIETSDDEDDNDSIVAQDEDEDDLPDAAAPIMARDDDVQSDFGTLSAPIVAVLPTLQLPSWLAEHQRTVQVPPQVPPPATISRQQSLSPQQTQPEASCEEVLKQQISYQNSQYYLSRKETPISAPFAAHVSSESEPDDYSTAYSTSVSSCGSDSTRKISHSRQHNKSRLLAFHPADVSTSTSFSRRKRGLPLDETYLEAKIETSKRELLSSLESEGTTGPSFKNALASLERYPKMKRPTKNKKKRRRLSSSGSTASSSSVQQQDCNSSTQNIDGTWLMMSPPEYKSSLGHNAQGESLFTLGRMAFDMYQPSNLVCSIQKQYNTICSVEKKDLPLYVPKSLLREVENERGDDASGRLKTYK